MSRTPCISHYNPPIPDTTLGLEILASEVRLKTSSDDAYEWIVDDPSLKSLFNRHLSKHSVGAYMQLCQEIGKSFRAVPKHTLRMDDLELENVYLTNKLRLAEQLAGVEAQQKAELEMEVINQKSDLYQAQLTISSLEDQVMWLSTLLEKYQQLSFEPCLLDQAISLLLSMRETMAPSNGQDC
ncbi:hypothetical protein BGW36DRAFT_362938 [Talaromyces proteolyticus]|uniref:Uncharacterized protein n=1 Tax=Talaromyces proteolyticus TaxID=1131652 RepID=A0AAD4KIC0_9EURO|nr:uncharacterized protein BGW36DRAFT_362938 [Talaromyces proteolyticus]KAH8691912.1 hypothetical protein BGW36DRAFT_362938 [Talaromyces proteolyticus]